MINLTEKDRSRFWKYVEKPIFNNLDCWKWKGYKNIKGYGQIWVKPKLYPAHRISFLMYKGSIPNGMVLDHICRIRNCVNPWHLRVVTVKENVLCGIGKPAILAAMKICSKGHPFNGKNLGIDKNRGQRYCKECRRLRQIEYRKKVKEPSHE